MHVDAKPVVNAEPTGRYTLNVNGKGLATFQASESAMKDMVKAMNHLVLWDGDINITDCQPDAIIGAT